VRSTKPYFENRISLVVRKRVGWLLLLFVAEMFTGTVLRHFDDAIERVVALSFFIPLPDRHRRQRRLADSLDDHRSLGAEGDKVSDGQRFWPREALSGLLLGLLLELSDLGAR